MSEQPSQGSAGYGTDSSTRARATEYWRRNIRYVGILLAVWFVVSYGFGIIAVEPLDTVTIPGTGFPLGFWFAQQGSIYVFVALIFAMNFELNTVPKWDQ